MMREKEKQRQEEHRRVAEGFPKWARRLQVGSKRLPDLGLTNVDAEEKCTRIFDRSLTLHILMTTSSAGSTEWKTPLSCTMRRWWRTKTGGSILTAYVHFIAMEETI